MTTDPRRQAIDHLTDRDLMDRIRPQARRLITQSDGHQPWGFATTVGAVATVTKIDPTEVVRIIEEYGYLMIVSRLDALPVEEWGVDEDGE